jgi:hypothetical protein
MGNERGLSIICSSLADVHVLTFSFPNGVFVTKEIFEIEISPVCILRSRRLGAVCPLVFNYIRREGCMIDMADPEYTKLLSRPALQYDS